MFDRIIQVSRNVKKLNTKKILKTVFDDKDLQLDIKNLNKDQMYEQGVDSKGKSLGEYHPRTIQEKIEKGQRYDHITLKDTGEFYDSIKVKSTSGAVVISADMQKPDTNLETIYPNALGLTDENLQAVQGLVTPLIIAEVRQDILK